MRVARLDEQLGGISAPQLEVATTVSFSAEDVVIVCAGFEDRATEVLRRAVSAGAHDFRVLCVEYLPPNPKNRSQEVRELCERAGARCETWTYDRENPADAADELLRRAQHGRLHIDISGMSRLLIVQLLAQATRDRLLKRATLWYTEALEYPPGNAEVEAQLSDPADALSVAMFLSSGVFGLTVVPELSSVAMQGQPIVLVAFPSWNTMQLAALRAELQASFFVVVHGVPPDSGNAWRLDAIARLNRSDTLDPRQDVRASTLDYRETLKALVDVYRAHAQREKIVVSPTGSKMQSVAVGIVCGWLDDLQVVYPTPRTFAPPDEYTRGTKAVYWLPLEPFLPPGTGWAQEAHEVRAVVGAGRSPTEGAGGGGGQP
jgi:hypothetical protein